MTLLIALFCALAAVFLFLVTFHSESEAEREHYQAVHKMITSTGGGREGADSKARLRGR